MKKVLKKKKKENFISKIQNVLYRKKLQQDSIQIKALKDIVEEKKQRNLKKTFKILKKVWLNIRVKKVNIYKSITVKVLLNSGIIEMFIDKEIVAKHRFRLQKLKKLLMVRNINGTYNSKKSNYTLDEDKYILQKLYKKNKNVYVQFRKNRYNIGNAIDQKIKKVKMIKCLLICKKNIKIKESIEHKKKQKKKSKV